MFLVYAMSRCPAAANAARTANVLQISQILQTLRVLQILQMLRVLQIPQIPQILCEFCKCRKHFAKTAYAAGAARMFKRPACLHDSWWHRDI